jgi:hypothetical protein
MLPISLLEILFINFYLFFCGTWVWIQGLTLAKQALYHLNQAPVPECPSPASTGSLEKGQLWGFLHLCPLAGILGGEGWICQNMGALSKVRWCIGVSKAPAVHKVFRFKTKSTPHLSLTKAERNRGLGSDSNCSQCVFLFIPQNQRVPADMIFLRTSEKNGNIWDQFGK